MKKLAVLFIALAMIFSLSACGEKAVKVYQGLGITNTGRKGPGKDNTETQVWSFNQVFVNALFDEDGKVVDIFIDMLEVATPNYDGASMPHFSGFPGQGGYNNDENHDEVIDGKTAGTEEAFFAEIAGWKSKRDRGSEYVMTTGTWTTQMDKFQEVFTGKTIAEVKEWEVKFTSDLNGRPLLETMEKPEDVAKFGKLTDDEKAELADVTTAATMSLTDAHGDILGALEASYTNKYEVTLK